MPDRAPVSRMSPDGDRLALGAYTVDRIPDLDAVAWPVQALLGSIDDAELDRLAGGVPASHLDRASRSLVISFNIYLVTGPGCRVIIDCGVGNDKERLDRHPWHRRRGAFLDNLGARGVAPEDVTHVVNTHLHADHVGWNTRLIDGAWRPTFPNARYIAPRTEFDHWAARHHARPEKPILHGAFADSVLPLVEAGRLDLVDLPSQPIPGFTFEPAPGHTPGMAAVWLHTDGGDVVFAADAVHHSLQFGTPDRASNFCFDPDGAGRTRRALLARIADADAVIAPYHLAPPTFGRVRRRGDAFAFVPLGSARAGAPNF